MDTKSYFPQEVNSFSDQTQGIGHNGPPMSFDDQWYETRAAALSALCLNTVAKAHFDPVLKPRHESILWGIYLTTDPRAMCSWASDETIASALAMQPDTLRKGLRDLERAGYIMRDKRTIEHASTDRPLRVIIFSKVRRAELDEALTVYTQAAQLNRDRMAGLAKKRYGVVPQKTVRHRTAEDAETVRHRTEKKRYDTVPKTGEKRYDTVPIGTTPYRQVLNTNCSSSNKAVRHRTDLPPRLDLTCQYTEQSLDDCVASYNLAAKQCGLPAVRALNDARRKSLMALLETYGADAWADAMKELAASKNTLSKFKFSFDWMIGLGGTDKSATAFLHLLEGNYRDKGAVDAGPVNPPMCEDYLFEDD